jgi:hypothetical protein
MAGAYSGKRLTKIVRSLTIAIMASSATLIAATAQAADTSSGPPAESRATSRPTCAAKSSRGPTRPEAQAKAESLVKDALYFEISGDDESRQQHLSAALSTAPKLDQAQWQSGHVNLNDRWLAVDEIPNTMARSLKAYQRQRDRSDDTLNGQLNLARWCSSNGLDAQARAHFNRVIEFAPDNVEARTRLGFRRLNKQWISSDQLEQMTADAQTLWKSINIWLPRVTVIRDNLFNAKEAVRGTAEQQFAEIKDNAAIPALEYVFSAIDEETANKLVQKLAEWSDSVSTRALIRQSLYSPWDGVRQSAALKLKERQREEYVPRLLAMMHAPVQVKTMMFRSAVGMVSRQVIAREGHDAWDVIMLDTDYYRTGPDSRNTQMEADYRFGRVQADMRRQDAAVAFLTALETAKTDELNARVMNTLALATEQSTLVRPEDWWSWWDHENETRYEREKSANQLYAHRTVQLRDEEPYAPEESNYEPQYVQPFFDTGRHSCFTAGTLVQTASGPLAIEKLRVGDLVLSQNPDSGELTLKPVLRTTVRQGAEVFTIETSGTTLHATGGHLFWVAGEGWTKARNLHAGQSLHCASGTLQVSLITQEPQPQQTYNLVVADFDTYFVGAERILTHDVTERKPTRSLVPGLARN